MSVSMHKPEARWIAPSERNFSYTFGGIQHYRDEINILSRNGYDHTSHEVTDRDGVAMTVAVLHRNGTVVKAYEL